MNQKKLAILIVVLIIIFAGAGAFLFFNSSRKETKTNSNSKTVGIEELITCPLIPDICGVSQILTPKDEGYEYNILSFHNSDVTQIFATFDGTIEVLDHRNSEEKDISIISADEKYVAQYKFLGAIAEGVQLGRGEVKRGVLIGFVTSKRSEYDKYYNFTLKIYNKQTKKYVKFGLKQSDEGMMQLVVK